MSYFVKLDSFSGPLDLLLHLIRKHEIDIYNIPISRITQEYLQTINFMKQLNLELAGEFILMASTLIYIKSRMLIPVYRQEDGEVVEEDPRQELVDLLVEYQTYQEKAKELGEKAKLGIDVFKSIKENDEDEPKRYIEYSNKDIDVYRLTYVFNEILKRTEKIKSYEAPTEEISLEEKVIQLSKEFSDGFDNVSMESIITEVKSRTMLVITFIALLELIKLGVIGVVYVSGVDDVLIYSKKAWEDVDLNIFTKGQAMEESGVVNNDKQEEFQWT